MIIDVALLVYCWFGASRGRRRKLSGAVYRLIKVTVAAMTGFSLFKLAGRILSLILGSFMSESLGFVLAFALPFLVLERIRKQLTGWIENKIGQEKNSRWGAVLGFVTNLLIGLVLIVAVVLTERGPVREFVVKRSYVANLLVHGE